MEPETTPARQRELAEAAPVAAPTPVDWDDDEPDPVWLDLYERGLVRPPYRSLRDRRDLAEMVAEWEPLGADLTTEDILRALGREIEPDGVESGGSAAAEPVTWPHGESSDAYPAPAVMPPRVELNGSLEDVLRAFGLPEQSGQLEQRRNAGTAQIDWGDEQPDPVWLDLYDQGLVDPPYRGPNAHAIADILDQRKPVRFKGNTEDILRALGRL